jgi:hypothetical protein
MADNEDDFDDVLARLCEPEGRGPLQIGEEAIPRLEAEAFKLEPNTGFGPKEKPATPSASMLRGKGWGLCFARAGIVSKLIMHLFF